jgi:metallo-beta-lactamase family protein
MHQLSTGTETYLLDCGMFQGHRREAFERNAQLPFEASSIKAVALSHAHLDHSGELPLLVKRGFEGFVYATPATADLCRYMLADSAFLQEKDAAFLEKRNKRRSAIGVREENPVVPPLYTVEDAENAIRRFKPSPRNRKIEIGPNITIELKNAGHILGSSSILLEYGANGRRTRVLFSGDLGRPAVPILNPPDAAPPADYLIVESTYGDRIHKPISAVAEKLAGLIGKTAERGGHVIVPAFAVGRTQELVVLLHRLTEQRLIPDIPIFADSPLAINVTDVFRKHPEEYSGELRDYLESGKDPFGFRRLRYLREVSESKALNDLRVPYVVISASGMCEGGRVLHHLRNGIEDPRNLILITGFQAENTLGRRLVERRPEVNIFGEPFQVRAEIASLNELSAHADQQDLIRWIRPIASELKGIFLVHGEPSAQDALIAALKQQLGVEARSPLRGESVELI